MPDSTTTPHSYAETEPWTTRLLPMPADVSEADARLALAVGLFLDGRVTVGRGAEIAQLPYRAFVDALAERKIAALTISGGDWNADTEFVEERRTVQSR